MRLDEVRAEVIESTTVRRRALAERLLLGALREQDTARDAVGESERAQFLAKASRELSISLDENTTRNTVRRLSLPRPGCWCIADVLESNGTINRLAVIHPDPAKHALAARLAEQWPATTPETSSVASVLLPPRHTVFTHDTGAALMHAAHGEANLRILEKIGFGSLLVVPLIVRARVQGAMTFVTQKGDSALTPEEIAFAVDLAGRCALALDNARLYREADALRLMAEAANQSKSQFLSSMSHELRTPLNAIGGYADLLEMEISGPVTQDQRVAFRRIKANQEHLLVLISEILSFVGVETGRTEYHYAEVPMQRTLSEVAEMLSQALTEKGLTVHGPDGDACGVAWADPDRVRQVFVNLLMNAIKYAAIDGGVVTLTCSVEGDTVVSTVADTGPGIPPEKLESIFEPFVQLTAGRTERRGGVGLGLAISRDLARAMGGDLTVESTVGVGSRFTLRLPLATPPPALS